MDPSRLAESREHLESGRGSDAAELLESASRMAPLDSRLAHDRLAITLLFGTPGEGRRALDHAVSVVESQHEANTNNDVEQVARDIAEVAPLALARFGAEDHVQHVAGVVRSVERLLRVTGSLTRDDRTRALCRDVLDLLWVHDDPRVGATRYVYRPRSPHTLQVEPTNRCNLKCTMCPRTTAMRRPPADMSVETYAQLLEGWSGAAPRFGMRIHAFGSSPLEFSWPGLVKLFFLGEILMHDNFAELVRVTRRRGAAVMPMTNGALLIRRSIRRKVIESDIQQLGISLDGIDAASYEAVRTGAAWAAVRDGILALCDELEAAGRRSSIRLHVNSILPEGAESAERNRGFLRPVIERVDSHSQTRISAAHPATFIDASGALTEIAHGSTAITVDRPSCFETLTKLNVLSDGRMTPCCTDIDGRMELGRMDRTVDEVWNDPATLALHRAHLTHRLEDYDLCRHCLGVEIDPARGLVPRARLEATRSIG
jgi:hypothetical protein